MCYDSRSSGLKSAATRAIERLGGSARMSEGAKIALAHEFQQAAFAQLEDKVVRAMTGPNPPKRLQKGWHLSDSSSVDPLAIASVVCSGGVASNAYLRTRLREALDTYGRADAQLHFPPLSLCVDNAAMIAWAGHLYWDTRTTDTTPHVVAKWPLD